MKYLILSLINNGERKISVGDIIDITNLKYKKLGKEETKKFLAVPYENLEDENIILSKQYNDGKTEEEILNEIENISTNIINPIIERIQLDYGYNLNLVKLKIQEALETNEILINANNQIKYIGTPIEKRRFNIPLEIILDWFPNFNIEKALDINEDYQPFLTENENDIKIDFSEKVKICLDKYKNSFRYSADKITENY